MEGFQILTASSMYDLLIEIVDVSNTLTTFLYTYAAVLPKTYAFRSATIEVTSPYPKEVTDQMQPIPMDNAGFSHGACDLPWWHPPGGCKNKIFTPHVVSITASLVLKGEQNKPCPIPKRG